jgi:S1-C subfamily serine protease
MKVRPWLALGVRGSVPNVKRKPGTGLKQTSIAPVRGFAVKIRCDLHHPDGQFRALEYSTAQITIGRDPASTLAFERSIETVSWNHARIEQSPGAAVLHDLSSTNGTYVNDVRVDGSQALHPGDRIRLGSKGPLILVRDIEGDNVQAPTVAVGRPQMLGSARADLDETSPTRRLLLQADKRHRRNLIIVACSAAVIMVVLCTGLLFQAGWLGYLSSDAMAQKMQAEELARRQAEADAQARKAAEDAAKARAKVDQILKEIPPEGQRIWLRMLKSTVFVFNTNGKGGDGAGALIDAKRKLVLTAYHVTPEDAEPSVFFPGFDKDGRPFLEEKYYLENPEGKKTHLKAKVVAHEALKDLAILQIVGDLPPGVQELPLAKNPANSGDTVHTVGHPGVSKALWLYNTGTVRVRHHISDQMSKPGGGSPQKRECLALEVQNPINPGDSGGALVNNQVEIVGVNSSTNVGASQFSHCIDVEEVRELLKKVP